MTDEAERRGIQTWLQTTGFPLEHVAGEALQAAGYTVRPSAHYVGVGPSGDRVRETDLIASEPHVDGEDEILLVVECKHTERPWIVRCTADVPTPEQLVEDLLAHRDTIHKLRDELVDRDQVPLGLAAPMLGFAVIEGPQTQPDSKTAAQPEKKPRDLPYAALQSVSAAARALVAGRSVYGAFWAVLPIIVIDGTLWTLPFEPGAEPQPAPWQKVRWEGGEGGTPILLDVVTASALAKYLEPARRDTQWLGGWMKRQEPTSISIIG